MKEVGSGVFHHWNIAKQRSSTEIGVTAFGVKHASMAHFGM
jgi:hypothetical protein